MTEMHERQTEKTAREKDDVRAADPEDGITSYQNLHAQDESLAEGDRVEEPQGNDRR